MNIFRIKSSFEESENVFYNFLDGNYSISQFENAIYESRQLPNKLDSDLYFELMSFNFKDSSQHKKLEDFIRQEIINPEDYDKWKLYNLFTKAGWKEDVYEKHFLIEDSSKLPHLFLKYYHGLSIGEVGKGILQAKSDVLFLNEPIESDLDSSWFFLGELMQIGYAHHENIILFMNNEGDIYIYIELTDEMYFGGTFEDTMFKLLYGLDYGEELIKQ